jgi:hypothetical protein
MWRSDPGFSQVVDRLFAEPDRTNLLIFDANYTPDAVEMATGQRPVKYRNMLILGNAPGWRAAALKHKGVTDTTSNVARYGSRYCANDIKQWVLNNTGYIPEFGWCPGNDTDIVFKLPPARSDTLRFSINTQPFVETDLVATANGVEVYRTHLKQGDFRTISFAIPDRLVDGRRYLFLKLHVTDAPSPLELGQGGDPRHLSLLVKWLEIDDPSAR